MRDATSIERSLSAIRGQRSKAHQTMTAISTHRCHQLGHENRPDTLDAIEAWKRKRPKRPSVAWGIQASANQLRIQNANMLRFPWTTHRGTGEAHRGTG